MGERKRQRKKERGREEEVRGVESSDELVRTPNYGEACMDWDEEALGWRVQATGGAGGGTVWAQMGFQGLDLGSAGPARGGRQCACLAARPVAAHQVAVRQWGRRARGRF